MDYLEWLKEQEEFVLFNLDYTGYPAERVELGEELQIIREIKKIVQEWSDQDDKHD
jgi:hypothetical protein